ncbi:type II toxin-antitoxin system RelE/ParE family toxin [Phyllobacterium sp. 628]|uniref:type II toxin-antitoxin system RelE/ParE family toxin n=1 Tax=Phyllobacterium sp. 628 TaxID=2718938 RepID=UPI001662652E|nr:type II toxin-antitoxin system RelE/ParE family toxin [Phyllobacterium sp. 628]QND50710.1 type II toxin-antitoxin system RelE/ParE family toxin [Phyllobacterium sp. 628]
MEYKVVFHPRAEQELVELYDYIHTNASAERAQAFLFGIREYCLSFSTFPKRGTVRDDVMKGVRIVGYRRNLSIAFAVTKDSVLILGIFYGGRNITTDLLEDRD